MTKGTFRFLCQRCGDCCKDPGQMLPKDLDKLASEFGISKRQFYERHCEMFPNLIGIAPKRAENGYCKFFSKTDGLGHCAIHNSSPAACRQRPMVPAFIGEDIVISTGCSGYGRGREIDAEKWARDTDIAEVAEYAVDCASIAMQKLQGRPDLIGEYMLFVRNKSRVQPSQELHDFFECIARQAYKMD